MNLTARYGEPVLKYRHPLFPATVVKRYNSMIIDIKLSDDSVVPAFCARKEINSICTDGMEVLVKRSTNKNRIIKYKIEYINKDGRLIFTSPRYEERLFKEAFGSKVISEFSRYTDCRRIEPDDHLPHIHFELTDTSGGKCFVFITTLYGYQGGKAIFPIGIDFFEIEMFEEMRKLRANGHETYVFMIVPQNNCFEAKFVWNAAPVAAAKLFEEAKNGLKFISYGCNVDKTNVSIAEKIEITY